MNKNSELLMSSKKAYIKRRDESKEKRFMRTSYIISTFISVIFILILILFKVYYIQLSLFFDLINPLFFGFLRVLFSIIIFIFSYIGLANYLEYNKEVIGWELTIILFIVFSLFVYFMFDFPSAPIEMFLSIFGGISFVFYLYIIQD